MGAALDAFRDNGVDGPSLDAICARAGLTRGAFYVHFADREALLVGVMERVLQRYLDAIVVTADVAHDLHRSLDRFVALATQPGHDLRLVLDATRRSGVVRRQFEALIRDGGARLAAVIAQGQAAGTVRGDAPPDVLAGLLVALVLGVVALVETEVPEPGEIARMRAGLGAMLTP